MKYRLKDKELQKKLDELSNGDFTRKLEGNSKTYAHEFKNYGNGIAVRVQFGEKSLNAERFHVFLSIDDVEQVQEYDPNEWNDFPAVKPPEDVWMRCEFDHPDGRTLRYIARYIEAEGNFFWMDQNMNEIDVSRFRPWEE